MNLSILAVFFSAPSAIGIAERMTRFIKFLLLSLGQLRVSASSEFIVVEGSFGDEWKDSVLVGEYKRVEGGSIRARNGDSVNE